jgi:hypothetical protein
MAVSQDMSAAAGDMSMQTPGTGQLVLADLVGTAFSGSTVAPRTHVLLALPSLPKFAGASDPSSNLSLTMMSGCTINRYTSTNLPSGDGDAGIVTFSGWNTTDTIAVNTKNGSNSAGPMGTNNPVTCGRFPPLMQYQCFFGSMVNTDGGVGASGALTTDVIFPLIPNRCVVKATGQTSTMPPCPPNSQLGWPYGQQACNPRFIPNAMDPTCATPANCVTLIETCEQSPINPLGVAQITEKLSGGADYSAAMSTIGNGGGTDGGPGQFPGPLFITQVLSGTTDITAKGQDPVTGGNGLSFSPDGTIDTTKSLTISFSCDPNNSTPGAGCTSATLAALLIQTDTGKRNALVGGLPRGVGQCISKPVTGQISVSAAQMAALVGTQTGGSIQLALANLAVNLSSDNGHTLVFTAGMGAFGFTNQ